MREFALFVVWMGGAISATVEPESIWLDWGVALVVALVAFAFASWLLTRDEKRKAA